jgi:hypothetical protein
LSLRGWGRFNFFCHSLDLLTFSNTNGAKTLFWPRLLIRFPPFPVTQKRRPFYSRAAFSVRLTVHFFVVYHVSLCQALQAGEFMITLFSGFAQAESESIRNHVI